MTVYVTHIHIPCHFRPKCCSAQNNKALAACVFIYKSWGSSKSKSASLSACHDSSPDARSKGLTRTFAFALSIRREQSLDIFASFYSIINTMRTCEMAKGKEKSVGKQSKRVCWVTTMLLDFIRWYVFQFLFHRLVTERYIIPVNKIVLLKKLMTIFLLIIV